MTCLLQPITSLPPQGPQTKSRPHRAIPMIAKVSSRQPVEEHQTVNTTDANASMQTAQSSHGQYRNRRKQETKASRSPSSHDFGIHTGFQQPTCLPQGPQICNPKSVRTTMNQLLLQFELGLTRFINNHMAQMSTKHPGQSRTFSARPLRSFARRKYDKFGPACDHCRHYRNAGSRTTRSYSGLAQRQSTIVFMGRVNGSQTTVAMLPQKLQPIRKD